ncbi:MAG: folate family ECF transporter S component [Clostridiales bacterium]|jgi:ECF transporter S component (folate family)|nr:folate family ECF transporter S component [Clostridiales bacterium]HOB63783.1 folate family ECF transporter S component [Clostridia bacterium]HOK81915.1 folate family ECF transporter S component [Clostridia bacterium]HOL61577.1 folate family ECF transporter S component [Clostridia bacterium]HPO54236.1 folate family ECF transporter S component [Clostridia bacterium]
MRIKPYFTTKRIAYLAILVAINVAINCFDINMGSLKMTFSYIPCFIAGIFLGPVSGLIVGVLGDVLGMVIAPKGAWIPLITVSAGLIGLIPGLICMIKKLNIFVRIGISLVVVFVVCTAGLNTFALFQIMSRGRTFWVYLGGRIGPQAAVYAINAVIIFLLYPPLKKYVFKKEFA